MKHLKPYALFIAVIVAVVVIYFFNPALSGGIVSNTGRNILYMLSVLPPIFILIGLLDVWVPREKFMRYMGEGSGLGGVALSVLLGAATAGPLYAGFPLAAVMIKKGVKFSNVLIFISAFASMKIPIVLFEVASLGQQFALTRWLLSLAGTIIIAFLITRFVSRQEENEIYRRHGGLQDQPDQLNLN